MDVHKNARLTPKGRLSMVLRLLGGESIVVVSRSLGLSTRTVRKWRDRYVEEGLDGLVDRSSRPHRIPRSSPADRVEYACRLRRDHRLSQWACGKAVSLPRSTLGRWLRRRGLGKLPKTEPREPGVRYEHARPGDLLHLDIKKLARFERIGHRIHGDRSRKSKGVGYDFIHVAIDDHSRLAYVEVHDDEKGHTAWGFLQRSIAWYARTGTVIRHLLTDNGSCYRSRLFREGLARLGIGHTTTRPYRPQTNGKAERFIGTMVREWAYARAYNTSSDRNAILPCWLNYYNHAREHGSLQHQPPASRVPNENNVLSTYS